MTTHTPGPFTLEEIGRGSKPEVAMIRYVIDSESGPVAILEVAHRFGLGEANAKLLAAAPDLLQACKTVLHWLSTGENPAHGCVAATSGESACQQTLMAAIEKAGGQ